MDKIMQTTVYMRCYELSCETRLTRRDIRPRSLRSSDSLRYNYWIVPRLSFMERRPLVSQEQNGRRWLRANNLLGRFIPPALLTYFFSAWYRCTFRIGPTLGRANRVLGISYIIFANVAIPSVTLLYLRLLFLPANQSVPPRQPENWLAHPSDIVECSPDETPPAWQKCCKGRCRGRWKPARARHCSDCGVCRVGFDHHCPIFNNCLTTPHIKTFLHMLLLAAPSVLLLSLPVYKPLYVKVRQVIAFSQSDPELRAYWWDWRGSWVVAGGPVGRWIGGTILGWRASPSAGPDDPDLGLLGLVGFGVALIGMTLGLAAMTIRLVLRGSLTVDFERARSRHKLLAKLESFKPGEAPEDLLNNIAKLSTRTPFWVPVDHPDKGVVVWTEENPYDLGRRANWELVMGRGWDCLKVWKPSGLDILKWPLAPHVESDLRRQAENTLHA